jgi:hypothetical protein
MWRVVRHYVLNGMVAAAAFVVIVLVLSAAAWTDPGDDLLTALGYETYADLTDEDVSTKPSGWTGWGAPETWKSLRRRGQISNTAISDRLTRAEPSW